MAWSFIRTTSGHAGGSSSDNVVLTLSSVGVDLFVVGAAVYQDGSYPTLHDNHSASWTQGFRSDGQDGNRHILPWYIFNPASDASYAITLDTGGGGNFMSGGVLAFSGSSGVFGTQVPTSNTALGTVSGQDSTIANASGLVASEDNMLLVGMSGNDVQGPTITVFDPSGGSTWADTGTNTPPVDVVASSGAYVGNFMSYRILGAGTSGTQYGIKFHENNFTGNSAGMTILSFKMASAAAGIPNRALDVNQAIVRASVW